MVPATIADYEILIYSLLDDFPSIHSSTLRVIRTSPTSGQIIGHLTFANDIQLQAAEIVDFDSGYFEILQYGYTIYQGNERLYWYDSQPHPNDPTLASSHPHHKHIPPDIKHHRVPAPNLSFTRPNLPSLIEEIKHELLGL